MNKNTRGSKPPDSPDAPSESFKTAEVEVTPPAPTAPGGAISSKSLKPVVVPAAEPEALPGGMMKVNLRDTVTINGRTVGPGPGCIVPADAFEVWRHALALE